jgi:CubicO group peptidase (beta-lactamase class C family)
MHTPLRAGVLTALAVAAPAQQPAPSRELLEVAAAYAAKVTASAVFVSGRTVDSVLAEELAPDGTIEAMIRPFLKLDVDREAGSVTCRLGAASATAVQTGPVETGLGCTLLRGDVTADDLRLRRDRPGPNPPGLTDWPEPPILEHLFDSPQHQVEGRDREALEQAFDAAFAEPTNGPKVRTRAVVVMHRGKFVAERYAEGYTSGTRLPGWSMTKTIVNALVGIRVRQGELDLDAPLRVPEWSAEGDPRHNIRLPHLLTMSSGLSWNEDYADPNSDALRMLFRSADHAAVYAQQPVAKPPGVDFEYASGSTNLICRILRTTFANDDEYWAFPREALFAPLGMRSAVLETDPSGTFVGSSYGFATARDWARFGQLYANDGVAPNGKRLLPEGWIARSAVPHPDSRGRCGMHLWLNADPDGDGPLDRPWPDLPADLLRMDGHEGQYVTVLPTQQLVVVRLGCTKQGGFDLRALLRAVLEACE